MALSAAQLQRNRVAILTRHHPDSPELIEARRDLAAAKLEDYIARTVAAAPPLTPAMRDRLYMLLRGGGAAPPGQVAAPSTNPGINFPAQETNRDRLIDGAVAKVLRGRDPR